MAEASAWRQRGCFLRKQAADAAIQPGKIGIAPPNQTLCFPTVDLNTVEERRERRFPAEGHRAHRLVSQQLECPHLYGEEGVAEAWRPILGVKIHYGDTGWCAIIHVWRFADGRLLRLAIATSLLAVGTKKMDPITSKIAVVQSN